MILCPFPCWGDKGPGSIPDNSTLLHALRCSRAFIPSVVKRSATIQWGDNLSGNVPASQVQYVAFGANRDRLDDC